ncbi:MAG: hypothetical protein KFW09_05435 [Oscillospiraceae bacterium]|nr:hypothetical protein [Oscillospiraceae bacterium]
MGLKKILKKIKKKCSKSPSPFPPGGGRPHIDHPVGGATGQGAVIVTRKPYSKPEYPASRPEFHNYSTMDDNYYPIGNNRGDFPSGATGPSSFNNFHTQSDERNDPYKHYRNRKNYSDEPDPYSDSDSDSDSGPYNNGRLDPYDQKSGGNGSPDRYPKPDYKTSTTMSVKSSSNRNSDDDDDDDDTFTYPEPLNSGGRRPGFSPLSPPVSPTQSGGYKPPVSHTQSGGYRPPVSHTQSGGYRPPVSSTQSGGYRPPVSSTQSGGYRPPVSSTQSGGYIPPVSPTQSGGYRPPVSTPPLQGHRQASSFFGEGTSDSVKTRVRRHGVALPGLSNSNSAPKLNRSNAMRGKYSTKDLKLVDDAFGFLDDNDGSGRVKKTSRPNLRNENTRV